MTRKWTEANISVEGIRLSDAESMTVRVALTGFICEMALMGCGCDDHGKSMANGYVVSGNRALKKMLVSQRNQQVEEGTLK